MHYAKNLFFICLFLIMSGCTPAPTITATLTAVPEATLPPPTTAPTRTFNDPALEAGQWAYIFYHDELEQVVMVNGGPERGKPADEPLELWGWDGTQWSLIAADEDGPTWRNWPAAAYDSARNVLVIHGGLQTGAHFDETWEWDGETWKRFTDTNGREGALMAYDEARAKMVRFGGSDAMMDIHGDTWEWDGQTWTMVSESGPAPRFPGGMMYDPARQEVLMYSGHFADMSGDAINYDDLWAWDGSTWRELTVDGRTPGHRTHAGFVYDPVTQNVLLISSGNDTFLSDMWAWDGTQWKELPIANTPARSGNNVAYDPKRDRFVLFGGVDRPGGKALDDTWEWDREQWSCVSNCQ
jgi:hypothetical protein